MGNWGGKERKGQLKQGRGRGIDQCNKDENKRQNDKDIGDEKWLNDKQGGGRRRKDPSKKGEACIEGGKVMQDEKRFHNTCCEMMICVIDPS